MIDLSHTAAPKSDQLNADDLIPGPRTIRVTGVSTVKGPEQPVSINFEGDGGRPYKPCKSMIRVLLTVWGADGTAYIGRRMTLYRDPKVRFGPDEVGGIRISHLSDMARDANLPLTSARGKKALFTVRRLLDERRPDEGKAPEHPSSPDEPRPKTGRERLHDAGRKAAAGGSGSLREFRDTLTVQQDDALAPILPELERTASDADDRDDLGFPGDPDDTFPGDRSEAA